MSTSITLPKSLIHLLLAQSLGRHNQSLACQSKHPHSYPNQHTKKEIKLIRDMAPQKPTARSYRAWYRLRKHRYSRTVESLFRCMRRKGLSNVKPIKEKRKSRPYEQRTHPSERIQIDVKVVPKDSIAGNELRLFQCAAIDESSRFRIQGIYMEQSACSSVDFLCKVVAAFKRKRIKVECVQTANDFEFTNRLSNSKKACQHDLKPHQHRPIHPLK